MVTKAIFTCVGAVAGALSRAMGWCSPMLDARSLEPFLNPVQVRILIALHGGPQTQAGIGALIDREARSVRKHMVKLHRWGLIVYRIGAKEWRLAKPWPDTLAALSNIMESHLRGAQSAIADLADVEPWKATLKETGKQDILSYLHEVRRRGP